MWGDLVSLPLEKAVLREIENLLPLRKAVFVGGIYSHSRWRRLFLWGIFSHSHWKRLNEILSPYGFRITVWLLRWEKLSTKVD